jgi:thiol-disulfide isomerase/thioredoxin
MILSNNLLLLIITTWCITAAPSAAFIVQSSSSKQQQHQLQQRARTYIPASASTSSKSRLMVVADAEQEEKSKQRRNRDDDDKESDNDWVPTATGGWFSPYLTRRLGREQPPEEEQHQLQPQSPTSPPAAAAPSTTPKPSKKKNQLMMEVKTMQQYKDQVVDEQDAIVCVRFYAPWCRACKAVEAPYRQLATKLSSSPESDNNKAQKVKFVQVPLTKENAYLHTGLGIPSLPYAHIYHPVAGLVEERSINKKIFGEFKDALQSYVDGECVIDWDSDSSNNDCNRVAQAEEPLQ